MKKIVVVAIGNYVPRQCGIATFNKDLLESLIKNDLIKKAKVEAYVVAVDDPNQTYDYPEVVQHTIRQDHQRDYLKAVKFVNYSNADICILQHEYGIYGGESGVYILSLIHRLEIPMIVVLHTVLKNPSYNEKTIVQEIARKAKKIVVMSKIALDFLTKEYKISRKKIIIIEHGVPAFDFLNKNNFKKRLNLKGKKSLLTFGLLSKDKGIETVINALSKVVPHHPKIIYIILGKTHPSVVKMFGEEYRNFLKRLVRKNNLQEHVYFYDRYVTNEELFSYLVATDIYITPYLNKAQITSGTLSYAIGAGATVISTPYWHARELLAEGRGRLYDFGDSNGLAEILNDLLDNPVELREISKIAYHYGRKTIWPKAGLQYFELISDTLKSQKVIKRVEKKSLINPLVLPDFSLAYIERLTDETGILQHAIYTVPNLKEGYCLDDNSRALLMSVMAYRQKKLGQSLIFIPLYLRFIHYMQNDDGNFKNFLSFDRRYLDEIGSEDSFGRTIWALGYLIRFSPNDAYFQVAKEIFSKSCPNFNNLDSLRGMAFTVIGISHYLHYSPGDTKIIDILIKLTGKIIKRYEDEKSEDWSWFESKITYANGIMPLALFHSYEIIEDKKSLTVAIETMKYLEKITFTQGYLSLIGNENWHEKGKEPSRYAQQPIDAMSMVLMAYQAYFIIKDPVYLNLIFTYFMWFLGENDLDIPLYDFETGGCCDGLEQYGVNRNQGAESSLSYLIAHLTVLLAYENGNSR